VGFKDGPCTLRLIFWRSLPAG